MVPLLKQPILPNVQSTGDHPSLPLPPHLVLLLCLVKYGASSSSYFYYHHQHHRPCLLLTPFLPQPLPRIQAISPCLFLLLFLFLHHHPWYCCWSPEQQRR